MTNQTAKVVSLEDQVRREFEELPGTGMAEFYSHTVYPSSASEFIPGRYARRVMFGVDDRIGVDADGMAFRVPASTYHKPKNQSF